MDGSGIHKTAAQIAQEEKLLKEAREKEKQALEAKRAQESKHAS
jgi:hypothetical protein